MLEPRAGELAHGPTARRSVMLRAWFACGVTFVLGVSLGAASDASAVPTLLGGVTAGGALLFTAGGSRYRPETIDTLGRRELVRARRALRPVTVVAVTVHGRPLNGDLQIVAGELAGSIRETDLIGYGGGNRLLLVFTETSGEDAVRAWTRLRAGLGPALAEQLRVGMASFPDDNSTWEGLKALARERERPMPSESTNQPRRPHGATVPSA
jgi:hypothetical protein